MSRNRRTPERHFSQSGPSGIAIRSTVGHNDGPSGGVQTGKGDGFKIHCPQGLVGSSPTRRIRFVTHARAEVESALALAREGLSPTDIERTTGIPRRTVRDWLQGRIPQAGSRRRAYCWRCDSTRVVFAGLTEHAYAYLLGMYLGDGTISAHPRDVYRLRIFQFSGYPRLVEECVAAMQLVMPTSKASVYAHQRERVAEINSFSKHWPCSFPQHGPGRKHNRPIRLADWQRAILERHPKRFLRGLIHSDGTRHMNTIRHPKKTYRYARYQFCNHSEDIRDLFCEYCDLIGIPWRQMNRVTISVARREAVMKMDRFIGPKT
jgi:hypothetical protein